jgi:hypothetical protein
MKKLNHPPVIEVGRENTAIVQRNGPHVNVILRPSKEVMRKAAYLAKLQYGQGSQTYQSIVCRM